MIKIKFLTTIFFVIFITETSPATKLHDLIKDVVPVANGKIYIPANIKHIKLDIGLSYSAPMSQAWLSQEKDLLVFGFEPNPFCVKSILNGAIKQNILHGTPLEKKFIGQNFFLIQCALGLPKIDRLIDFYVTKDDWGCSSIFYPKNFEIQDVVKVPIFPLSDFFDLFPFETHPVIDYIKVDAQGSDLDIIKSAKDYLKNHVIYITLEAENDSYQSTTNSHYEIDSYMKSIGFTTHISNDVIDPTYFNPRFAEYIKTNKVKIYQKG